MPKYPPGFLEMHPEYAITEKQPMTKKERQAEAYVAEQIKNAKDGTVAFDVTKHDADIAKMAKHLGPMFSEKANRLLEEMGAAVRTFETGATRDTDDGKFDYEGFLSPLVLERYGAYMHSHRKQADGKLRDSDNWQKGIPLVAYIKSLWRHFFDVWKIYRGLGPINDKKDGHLVTIDEALCAVIFNASGYLHEILKKQLDHERKCKSCGREAKGECSYAACPRDDTFFVAEVFAPIDGDAQ
jgi:hypothetical protein